MNNKISNSLRKTPRKYFLRNECHEYIIEKAKEENVSPSSYLQKLIDIYIFRKE